jgi:hypothetical protein
MEALFNHCEKQCIEYGGEDLITELKNIIFDVICGWRILLQVEKNVETY